MKWPWKIYPSWQLEYGPSWNVKGGRNYDDYKYPLKRVHSCNRSWILHGSSFRKHYWWATQTKWIIYDPALLLRCYPKYDKFTQFNPVHFCSIKSNSISYILNLDWFCRWSVDSSSCSMILSFVKRTECNCMIEQTHFIFSFLCCDEWYLFIQNSASDTSKNVLVFMSEIQFKPKIYSLNQPAFTSACRKIKIILSV